MKAQYYWQSPANRSPIPENVILETAELLKTLRKRIEALTEADVSEESLLETIVCALGFEKNLQLELDVSCQCFARDLLGAEFAEKADVAASAMSEFGVELFKKLKDINAYQNGYLFYTFMRLLGKDMVLVRMEVPDASYNGDECHVAIKI